MVFWQGVVCAALMIEVLFRAWICCYLSFLPGSDLHRLVSAKMASGEVLELLFKKFLPDTQEAAKPLTGYFVCARQEWGKGQTHILPTTDTDELSTVPCRPGFQSSSWNTHLGSSHCIP